MVLRVPKAHKGRRERLVRRDLQARQEHKDRQVLPVPLARQE